MSVSAERTLSAAALCCIAALAWALDVHNAGFPYQYHGDENAKVAQLRDGTQNFLHPILMLQSVRATLAIAPLGATAQGSELNQAIAERGRRVSAFYATASVVLAYFLFRRFSPPAAISPSASMMALAATLLVAVAPIRVVHAHYLKEDTFLAAALTASLLAFSWFLERRDRTSLVLWGATTGIACASKYFGASILIVYALTPLVANVGNLRNFYRQSTRALAVAALVFAAVNFPAFAHPIDFLSGIGYETKHALVGHTLRLFPWTHWMTFHFTQTIVPGVGLGVAVAGLAGMIAALRGFGASLPSGERIFLLYAGVIYLLLELSPTKPHPAFIRYGLPLAPVFAWFAVRAVVAAAGALERGRSSAVAIALVFLIAEPAWNSVRLVQHLESDTRLMADQRIATLRPAVAQESYTGLHRDFKFAPEQDLRALRDRGIRDVVVSSHNYDRFEMGERLRWQPDQVYDLAARYRALFTCPYDEIKPAHRTFAFSNPTLRIIDLAGCPAGVLVPPR